MPLNRQIPLRIDVQGQQPERSSAIADQWSNACIANPRLFDGSILAVRAFDGAGSRIDAYPERFAHVVCPPPSRVMRTTILSVTGVIEAVLNDQRCVLLAKRGSQTRSYPGMWEFAPAGGLHPADNSAVLSLEDVLKTLNAELSEEVGIDRDITNAQSIGVVADVQASSMDIVVRAAIPGSAPKITIHGEHAWECADARWVPIEKLDMFLKSADGGVIGPTWAIARHLGW